MANMKLLGEIYRKYVETCYKSGAMDFDDLLLRTNELLTRFPEVLAKYQDRFRYILVDEYQDTNHSQYLIVKALASKFENLCVVGDDAQSIYAFRGANIYNILNFKKDYPDAVTVSLEQNYRSTQNIVNAANDVIAKTSSSLRKMFSVKTNREIRYRFTEVFLMLMKPTSLHHKFWKTVCEISVNTVILQFYTEPTLKPVHLKMH